MISKDTTHIQKMAEKIKKINPENPLLKTMRKRFQEIKEPKDDKILLPPS